MFLLFLRKRSAKKLQACYKKGIIMRLSSVVIRNYRLLTDASLEIDPSITLIVGRNNTAKTSFFKCIEHVIKGIPFSFDDYPIKKRKNLCDKIAAYIEHKISYKELCNQIEAMSIEFIVDYTLDDPEDNLGALSPFIIDVDLDITKVLIHVDFRIKADDTQLRKVLEESFYQDGNSAINDKSYESVSNIFTKIFGYIIYAVNPKNKKEKQIKSNKELQELFPIFLIPAERQLGEDGTQNNSLVKLISDYFDTNIDDLDPSIAEKAKELRAKIGDANKTIQHVSDEILSELVNNAIGFGYPNSEEMQLGVITQLSIDEQIKNQTRLSYTTGEAMEKLPSTYNGLGYKNLIKIEFLLASFAKEIDKIGNACIPLLFIEEPESHMHPQMQQCFADYLEKFLKRIIPIGVQTLITSHSAHITNTIDFSKIRYAQKTTCGVIYKNLNAFVKEHNDNIIFIRKYLTLTKCDLFFADKAILVEGASERLLIPDMIEKCSKAGKFSNQKYPLPAQYYSLIEIGGAYAHIFIPFISFLGIPCLILTDLDPVANTTEQNGQTRFKSVHVSKGETTSNETLKWWIRQNNGDSKEEQPLIPLSEITQLPPDKKTRNKCHIEFQTYELELCGPSLEEAIRNVNREYYHIDQDTTEEDLKFKERSKTDFALNLIFEHPDYTIPQYIEAGLIWLNNQTVLE